MDKRRQADVPWADAHPAARIAMAVGVAVIAVLMAISISSARGFVVGVLLVLFWGGLGVLAFGYPRTLQGWARERWWFAPVLTFGVVLFALLFLTAIPTSIALFFSAAILVVFAVIARVRRRRPAPPTPPSRGRRHN